MNEEEKEEIELDIEAKYVGKTEKEFLSRVTYAECIYILTPENKYCDKIKELSVLKICEIIEKLQKENEELKEKNDINIAYAEYLEKILNEYKKESVSKQKVKDKIEESNNNRQYLSQFKDYKEKDYTNEEVVNNCVEILQELLESE